MAHNNYVFCLCCNAEIPWSHKCEHQWQLNAPYTVLGPSGSPSQQQGITGSNIKSNSSDSGNTASSSLPAIFDEHLPMLEANSLLDEEGNNIKPTDVFEANHQHKPLSNVDADEADILKQHWPPQAGWTAVHEEGDGEIDFDADDKLEDLVEMMDNAYGMGNNDNNPIDWEAIKQESGLSAWDLLGEAYDQE
ncbi:hypothetical protein DXG03_009695, partial [Asterophora parasitica]